MTTQTITPQNISFSKVMKAGFIAAFISAALNNTWSLIAQLLGSEAPPGFPVAVTISSILPVLIGAVLYYALVRFTAKGQMIFTVISVLFTLVSLYPTFTTTALPDGTPVGEGFTLLTLPMHLISGAVAIWAIPKFSK